MKRLVSLFYIVFLNVCTRHDIKIINHVSRIGSKKNYFSSESQLITHLTDWILVTYELWNFLTSKVFYPKLVLSFLVPVLENHIHIIKVHAYPRAPIRSFILLHMDPRKSFSFLDFLKRSPNHTSLKCLSSGHFPYKFSPLAINKFHQCFLLHSFSTAFLVPATF